MTKRIIALDLEAMVDQYLDREYGVSVQWEKDWIEGHSLVLMFDEDDLDGPASKVIQFAEDTVVVHG